MPSSRDPFPFPRLQNDDNFVGICSTQVVKQTFCVCVYLVNLCTMFLNNWRKFSVDENLTVLMVSCCNLSIGMVLNARCTTNRMCTENNTYM